MRKWSYERLSLNSHPELRDFILDIEDEEYGQPLYPPSCETPLFTEYKKTLKAAKADPIGVEMPYVPVILTPNGYEFSHEGAKEEAEKLKGS